MSAYNEEQKRIEEKIWSFIHVKKGDKVLDVGVGGRAASTRRLLSLGAVVTALDINSRLLKKHRSLNANMVCGDISWLPFASSTFNFSLAYGTLHEVNPDLHQKVISELARVSQNVIIVEPDPVGDQLYSKFSDIWRRAMHSIGKFEDYQQLTYWRRLLEKSKARVLVCEKIAHERKLMGVEAERFIEETVENAKSYGVPERYLREFRDLTEDVKHLGMLLSDLNIIIGKTG